MVRKSIFIFGLLDEGTGTLGLIFKEWREVVKKKKNEERWGECFTASPVYPGTARQNTKLLPKNSYPVIPVLPFDLRNDSTSSDNISQASIRVFKQLDLSEKSIRIESTPVLNNSRTAVKNEF